VKAAFLLLAPLALVAASCGDTVSIDPVAKAADTSQKQMSEHMDLDASVTAGTQVIAMTGSGDFANAPTRGQFLMRVRANGRDASMQEVLDGTRVYISSPALMGQLPGAKKWMSVDVSKAGKALGIDVANYSSQSPQSVLDQLKTAGGVAKIGPETLDGVATTHYRATIDPAKVAKVFKKLQITPAYEPVDVWIDDQGLVRRMHMAYSAKGSTTDMTASFSKYGEPVSVSVPAPDDTFDATGMATNGGSS
jgi:hypothetical protein